MEEFIGALLFKNQSKLLYLRIVLEIDILKRDINIY